MNTITVTGRLTGVPARVETARGVTAGFRLAVHGRHRIWIDVDTWGRLAGTCAAHLAKGRTVAVTGRLACDEWTGRDGDQRTRWHIIATAVTFLDAPCPDQ